MSPLSETELYKKLPSNSRYKENIDIICNKFQEHLTSCHAFRSYTSHSIDHSVNIINYMWQLSPNPSHLNDETIYYLILAAICHDFGLLLTNKDKEKIKDNQYIVEQSDYYFWDKTKEYIRLHNPQLKDYEIVDLTIEFIARNLHTNKEVLSNKIDSICSCLSIDEKKNLVFICYSHGADPEVILEQLKQPEYILANAADYNSTVDFGFVIALLLLGDILDIGADRVIKTSKEYNYFDKENRKHEIINSLIKSVDIGYKSNESSVCSSFDTSLEIPCPRYPKEISLSYNNDYFSNELQQKNDKEALFSDSLNYLFNYIAWIEEEIANAKKYFLHQYLDSSKYSPTYYYATTLSISPKVNMQGFPHNFEYREIGIDRNLIVNLITSENLYSNKKSFLRELIQNAIDACTFYSAVIGNSYCPEVKISLDNDTLSITDNGIGMNYNTLTNCYLKIGGSYYNSNEYIFSKKSFSHAGHFGIGGYSAFLVSDEVIIETKKYDQQNCIKVEYGKAQNYVKISRGVTYGSSFSKPYEHGTKIILKLKDEFKKTFKDVDSIKKYIITTFLKYENVSLKLLVQENEYNLSEQLNSIDEWCKYKNINIIKEPEISQLDNYLEGIKCRIIYNQITSENKFFNQNSNKFEDECNFEISEKVLVYSYENKNIKYNYVVPYPEDKFYYGNERLRVVQDLCIVEDIPFTKLDIPINSTVNRFTAEIISIDDKKTVQKTIRNSSFYSSYSGCSVHPKLDIFLHNIRIKNADFNLEFMPNIDIVACVLNITHPLVVPSISRDDIPIDLLKQIREAIFYAILKKLNWTIMLPKRHSINNPFIKEEDQ